MIKKKEENNDKYPLDKINFYIENFIQRGEEFKKPQLISSVDTVENFFRHYNTIFDSNFRNLIIGKTIHMMKDGIEPVWESKSNKYGGILTFVIYLNRAYKTKFGIANLLDLYLDNLLLFVGNTFKEKFSSAEDDINGISFSKRKIKVLIKIWHKNSENKDNLETMIREELSEKSLDTMDLLAVHSYYQIINKKVNFKSKQNNK